MLGSLAKHEHSMGCRQALVGGRYALVDLRRRRFAPDFYVQLLWRQLMSPKVLRVVRVALASPLASSTVPTAPAAAVAASAAAVAPVEATAAGSAPAAAAPAAAAPAAATAASGGGRWAERLGPHLRAYAHCARASASLPGLNVHGGVTVLLINLHPNVSFSAEVDNLPALEDAAEAASTPRLEFILTSAAAPPPSPPVAASASASASASSSSVLPPTTEAAASDAAGNASSAAAAATANSANSAAAAAAAAGDGIGVEQLERLLSSPDVLLNGHQLEPDASGALPRLRSTRVKGPHVRVAPLSVGFYVFPEAGVKSCMTEKQEKVTNKLKRAKRKHGAKPDEKKKSSGGGVGGGGGSDGGGKAADCDGDPEYCRNYYQK